MKAAIFPRQPTDWLTPDVRSAARGLRNAQNLSFEFQNYLMADDLMRLLQVSDLSTEFGQAAFYSFLFLIRVPSETLSMRKADLSDRLTEFPHQEHKVMVGMRAIGRRDFLLAKFSRRGILIADACYGFRACAWTVSPWPRPSAQPNKFSIGSAIVFGPTTFYSRHFRRGSSGPR